MLHFFSMKKWVKKLTIFFLNRKITKPHDNNLLEKHPCPTYEIFNWVSLTPCCAMSRKWDGLVVANSSQKFNTGFDSSLPLSSLYFSPTTRFFYDLWHFNPGGHSYYFVITFDYHHSNKNYIFLWKNLFSLTC